MVQSKTELKRSLGILSLMIVGMMTMAPLAPFQVFGTVAQASYGMVALVYLIGATLMFFTALSYKRFSQEFPISGSVYSYVSRGVNPHVGFLAGWTILSDYILCPALMCLFSSLWLTALFPDANTTVLAIAFVVIAGLINIRGIELSSKVNNTLFAAQIVAVLLFVGFMVKFVFIDGQGFGGFSLEPLFQKEHISWSFVASATSLILLGFVGFDTISTLAEEAKNPRKTVGLATVLALSTTAIIFFMQSYLAGLAHKNYMDLNPDMALFDIAKEVGGQWFYVAMIIINIIAVGLAVTLNIQAAVSRVLYAMGRDDAIIGSKYLSKLHPKYQTPYIATIFSVVLSIVLILTLDINTIVMFVNFGAVTAFLALNLSVIYYFFFKKKERSVKEIIFHLIAPLIGAFVCGFVWTGFDQKTMLVGVSWIVIGAIIGFIKTNGYKRKIEFDNL